MEITKEDRIMQFNYLFTKLMREIRELCKDNVGLISKIDVVLGELKNRMSIVVLNNFIGFGCKDPEIVEALSTKNIKFFEEYTLEKYKKKFRTEQLYDLIMGIPRLIKDKQGFISKVDDLRKVAMSYDKM